MDIKKAGTYVCLLPTDTKLSLRKAIEFKNMPIDIQFFGVIGHVLEDCSSNI